MRRDDRFDDIDKAALHNALLDLGQCPHCRRPLRTAQVPGLVGCVTCDKAWPAPETGPTAVLLCERHDRINRAQTYPVLSTVCHSDYCEFCATDDDGKAGA